MPADGIRTTAFIHGYGEEEDEEVPPSEVGAKVCHRVDCEFAWFVVEGFRECPACELRELRRADDGRYR